MYRLVVVILFAVATSIACAQAPTQANEPGLRIAKKFGLFGFRRGPSRGHTAGNFRGSSSGYRTSTGAPVYGYGIGTGYSSFNYGGFGYLDPYRFDGFGYDPYRYGSFRAPDLLDDPYFQANSLYLDKYPAYRRQQERLRMRSIPYSTYPQPMPSVAPIPQRPELQRPELQPPASTWRQESAPSPYAAPSTPTRADSYVNAPAGNVDLQSSTRKLQDHLAARQDGDVWISYLSPDRIESMIQSDDRAGLEKLMTHYDGVVANGQLGHIVRSPGFQQTREMLRQLLQQSEIRQPASAPHQREADPEQDFAPAGTAIENLPVPAPTPDTVE